VGSITRLYDGSCRKMSRQWILASNINRLYGKPLAEFTPGAHVLVSKIWVFSIKPLSYLVGSIFSRTPYKFFT
jgi:hypothetical protein